MREKLLVSFFILSGFVRYAEKPKSRANFDFAEYGFRYEKHNGQNKNDKGLRWRFFSADRKSTRLNSSHVAISYAVFCLKKKNRQKRRVDRLAISTAVFAGGHV